MSLARATTSSMHKMCTSTCRSVVLTSTRSANRSINRSIVALASSPSLPSISTLPHINAANSNLTTTRRHYSLDRPNSSPFQIFSQGGSSSDSSPHGQSLEISQWPLTKVNTILNIVPQGKRMVVERFGKLHDIHES